MRAIGINERNKCLFWIELKIDYAKENISEYKVIAIEAT